MVIIKLRWRWCLTAMSFALKMFKRRPIWNVFACSAYTYYICSMSHADVHSTVSGTGKVFPDKFWMSSAKPKTLSLTNSCSSSYRSRCDGGHWNPASFSWRLSQKLHWYLDGRRRFSDVFKILIFDLQETSAVRIQRPEDVVARITHYTTYNNMS